MARPTLVSTPFAVCQCLALLRCADIAAALPSDMSPALFQQLGSLDQGVLPISWHFKNRAFKLAQ